MSRGFTQQWYANFVAKERAGLAKLVTDGVDREADLHDAIMAECRRRGWLPIHSRMDKASHATVGCPDFLLLCDGGRILLVEAKRKGGKLRPEQQAFAAWAAKLGHTVHVVRSMEEFQKVISEREKA